MDVCQGSGFEIMCSCGFRFCKHSFLEGISFAKTGCGFVRRAVQGDSGFVQVGCMLRRFCQHGLYKDLGCQDGFGQ